MSKAIAVGATGALVSVAGLILIAVLTAGSGTSVSGAGATGPIGSDAGAGGTAGVGPAPALPAAWAELYQQAATTCPGLSWSVLAAIGTVESANGQSTSAGVRSGTNTAGAEGPMQFEPATFDAHATVGPNGVRPASPYDPVDAVYTASSLLCADGAASASGLRAAVEDYNRSDTYANTVLTLALAFGQDPVVSGTVVAALSFAAARLNTPYLWGGTGSGGFDCSGLAQAAYLHAGITLPRVAQDQFDAGPPVPAATTVEPGDLIFFGSGPTGVDHVGIYVGAGEMIDAPHTGALVRFDDAGWSGLVGATRPA